MHATALDDTGKYDFSSNSVEGEEGEDEEEGTVLVYSRQVLPQTRVLLSRLATSSRALAPFRSDGAQQQHPPQFTPSGKSVVSSRFHSFAFDFR